MNAFLLAMAVVVGLLTVVGLYRITVGPTTFDRVMGAALITANGLVLLLLVSFLFGRLGMFIDIAIAYGLLAFVLPVALGKYYESRRGRQ